MSAAKASDRCSAAPRLFFDCLEDDVIEVRRDARGDARWRREGRIRQTARWTCEAGITRASGARLLP